eukprot:GSA25T00011941001.1
MPTVTRESRALMPVSRGATLAATCNRNSSTLKSQLFAKKRSRESEYTIGAALLFWLYGGHQCECSPVTLHPLLEAAAFRPVFCVMVERGELLLLVLSSNQVHAFSCRLSCWFADQVEAFLHLSSCLLTEKATKLSLHLQIVDEANQLEREAFAASCECDEDLNVVPSYADIVRRPRRFSQRASKQCFTSIFKANPSDLVLAASQHKPSLQSCKNEADHHHHHHHHHHPPYSKNAFPTPSLSLVVSSNTNRTSTRTITSSPRTSPICRLSSGTKTNASTSYTTTITATHQCKESHQGHLLLSTSTPASSTSDDTEPAEPEHEYNYKL